MPKSIWDPEIQAAFDQVPRHRAGAARREARATAARATERLTAEAAVGTPAPFPSPEDWRDIPIYFLMLDRFNNPAAAPSGTQSWDASVDVYRGGTFNGVREQLDYLAELGVRALWLSPVLQNRISDDHAYHGYGIQHFAAINPRFASDYNAALQDPTFAEGELRQLIEEAHRRGIYIIFDIVLNHAGDVFAYAGNQSIAPWQDSGPYAINWRDENGDPRPDWTDAPADPPLAAAVWPAELRRNDFFRRQGNAFTRGTSELQEEAGDFYNLKEFVTAASVQDQEGRNRLPVQETLIRAYQYLIAKYDIDGFRIDTLKFIEPSFAHNFGNAIREYALSIGKQNFFTFGEVADSEDKIAQFIGRNTSDPDETVGVDAALDFPLFNTLPHVAKASQPPSDLIHMFEYRKGVQQHIISSHGEASRYFVTFLDNHDKSERFGYLGPGQPSGFDAQVTTGFACLLTLQGIPCIYYGTEQGLHGQGGGSEAVREALWGKPGAFDRQHPFYIALRDLIALRNVHPALRYGRQYFRPLSGNGTDFGVSVDTQGVLAYSRILNDREVLVVANTNTSTPLLIEVIVDLDLNASVPQLEVYYSNTRDGSQLPGVPLIAKQKGSVNIAEVNGSRSDGPARSVRVQLEPMEVQILGRPQA